MAKSTVVGCKSRGPSVPWCQLPRATAVLTTSNSTVVGCKSPGPSVPWCRFPQATTALTIKMFRAMVISIRFTRNRPFPGQSKSKPAKPKKYSVRNMASAWAQAKPNLDSPSMAWASSWIRIEPKFRIRPKM